MIARPDWIPYYLGIVAAVSRRGECSRRQVGAIVVKDRRFIYPGYNGAPPGSDSCLDGFCPRAKSSVPPGSSYDTGEGACIAIHAEENALLVAGLENTRGAEMFVTSAPCLGCTRLIKAAGIWTLYYTDINTPLGYRKVNY